MESVASVVPVKKSGKTKADIALTAYEEVAKLVRYRPSAYI